MEDQNKIIAEENQDILLKRVFDSPVEKVWRAWSDPREFKKWWGSKHFTSPYIRIDFKENGKYLWCMRGPDGKDYWNTGIYNEIVLFKKIAYTDSFADENGKVVPSTHYGMKGFAMKIKVSVTFEEENGKTIMILRQKGIPIDVQEDCKTGWNQSLDKMEKNLKSDS